MEGRGKSGTIAGSILGLAAAVMFNVLTAAPPEQQTAHAAAPAAVVQHSAQTADPCELPKLTPASHQPQNRSRS